MNPDLPQNAKIELEGRATTLINRLIDEGYTHYRLRVKPGVYEITLAKSLKVIKQPSHIPFNPLEIDPRTVGDFKRAFELNGAIKKVE